LSGIFGLIVLDYEVTSPIGLNSPVLFPALAGLFGFPTLINSLMTEPVIPDQKIEKISLSEKGKKSSVISVITGSIAGIFVSIIPGITSATGTVIAMNAREGSDHEQTIVTLSSVNTASSFAVILVLFIILRPRSGAAIAVNELIIIEEWLVISIPQMLSFLVIFIVLAGSLSYFFTIVIGRFFARGFSKIPYTKLVAGTILMVGVLVFLFTGVVGILVLFVATSIGFIPVLWGVRRSHCMGILLVPIIIHFLGV
jgi:putative membrane protein